MKSIKQTKLGLGLHNIPLLRHPIPITVGTNMHLPLFFAAVEACSSLGTLSSTFWNIAVGICFYSVTRAFERLSSGVASWGLACSQHTN